MEFVDKFFKLNEELPTLCCSYVFPAGSVIRVIKEHSEKRLIVKTEGSVSLHKVKKSTLNRCGELIEKPSAPGLEIIE